MTNTAKIGLGVGLAVAAAAGLAYYLERRKSVLEVQARAAAELGQTLAGTPVGGWFPDIMQIVSGQYRLRGTVNEGDPEEFVVQGTFGPTPGTVARAKPRKV